MPLLLTADHMSVDRRGRHVLDGVSFSLKAGEALVVTGPNGAGKTTLLRTIAGFLPVISGRLRLDGGDAERELAQHCHYAGHHDAVKTRLTVAENLQFWSKFLAGRAADIVSAMSALALSDLADVSAAYLSAGQHRRLGLARLMVAERPIWLLDEPTVSLDHDSTAAFVAQIERHRARGGMVIAATHVDLGLDDARSLRLVAPERAAA